MSENTGNPKLRNAKACEACRASKSKCVYKKQAEPGICQKCEQNGTQCIVRSKARPMRTRAARPAGSSDPSSVASNAEFSLSLAAVHSLDTTKEINALHIHHMNVFGDEAGAQIFEEPDRTEPGQPTIVEKRRLTLIDAEELLASYRTKASFFPFVKLAPEATVPSLSRTSPFLLLAILTSASLQNLELHHQIDQEFRRVLSSKVLLQGQKSLDFLQGLLVYIAWYPAHVNPRDTTSFMYLNLAISLLVDLGLDQETPNAEKFSPTVKSTGLIEGDQFTENARKTYLGCYYMSSAADALFPSIKRGFRKPNNGNYRDLLDKDGEGVMQEEFLSEIGSTVKLQRLCEQIGDVNALPRLDVSPQMEALNDEVNIQMFLGQLHEWQYSTPAHIKCQGENHPRQLEQNLEANSAVPVVLAEIFMEVLIYGQTLGFFRTPYKDFLKETGYRPMSITHLTSCLNACKRYFDYLLSLPETAYIKFTSVHWGYVVHSIVAMSRLSFAMAAKLSWNEETARSQVPLVMYLDCLAYRFQLLSSIPARTDSPPKHSDVYHVFHMILGSVKKSYEKRISKLDPQPPIGHAFTTGHCPMMDYSLNTYFDPLMSMDASSFEPSGSGTPSIETPAANVAPLPQYHDIWATMTGSWADEF
ncbi:uncharacterized protein RAG0_03616 [Rhynchosporium agropyri]|uniref:Zn(2)-C6 fungal-type domain-containing protein n=1 Tax=Rhynchosporium agropyri TaxID=914238 RepID=A0A1E1K557_9HELO|nr:uncharacterized protein RAG0_03616 [Rhynchosporium agropyri]